MVKKSALVAGKIVRHMSRIRGGGSALPGLVVEKIDPQFLSSVLADLPYGVVVISGTNGKTTTTKIVTSLLESQGLNVFTNPTGSNFTRGVASAALAEMKHGRLDADIAVLELDEAHAVHFVRQIKPRFSLLLNVLRDQMDRFGEIDKTASLLGEVVAHTTDTTILNRNDARVARLAHKFRGKNIRFFGFDENLSAQFPEDDELYGGANTEKMTGEAADVTLMRIDPPTFIFDGQMREAHLRLSGVHNILNTAAALTLIRAILGEKTNYEKLFAALANIKPAFGRGEKITIGGQPLELFLVKNPAGFRLSLKSHDPKTATMIAINDEFADGRDMSWLWDVDFTQFNRVDTVSGIRGFDMALRLKYDMVTCGSVELDLAAALTQFLQSNANRGKQIFCTYTAMLKIRKLLANQTDIEKVL